MSSQVQRQIALVLKVAVQEHRKLLNERLQQMYASHSAKGRLHSGATVQVAVQAMDEIACDAVQSMCSKVIEVARGPEAFSAFQLAVSDLIEFFRDEMPTVVRMASGRMPCPPSPSIENAASGLFDEMESKIEQKVEIAEYSFTEPLAHAASLPFSGKPVKTGRPTAAFWDGMWASIASALYAGDLKPRTQSDIEQAMLEWIENEGHSAAISTVRGRARRLWDLIQSQG